MPPYGASLSATHNKLSPFCNFPIHWPAIHKANPSNFILFAAAARTGVISSSHNVFSLLPVYHSKVATRKRPSLPATPGHLDFHFFARNTNFIIIDHIPKATAEGECPALNHSRVPDKEEDDD